MFSDPYAVALFGVVYFSCGLLLGAFWFRRPSNSDDVGEFHRKFGLDNTTHRGVGPREVSDDLLEFRLNFLHEELAEFTDAALRWDNTGRCPVDHAKAFDALLDLVYVALGTAHLMGYPWQEGWDLVQRANMQKRRAAGAADALSKRGSAWDVVKPPGWQPPAVGALLAARGWPAENSPAGPPRTGV